MSLAGKGIQGQTSLLDSVGGSDLMAFAKGQVISTVFLTGGNPTLIRGLWLFDEHSGTTLQDKGPANHDLTLSADASTLNHAHAGLCHTLELNGQIYTAADHADFSFGDGSTDSAFSILVLVKPLAAAMGASQELLTKYAGSNREWGFHLDSGNLLSLTLWDESSGGTIARVYNSNRSGDAGAWHTYGATYSGSSVATGIKLFRDGIKVDDTTATSGSYTAMEPLGSGVGNFYSGSLGPFKGRFGAVFITADEFTEAKMLRADAILRGYVGVDL